jgi:ATP-dependent DNA ligase
MSLEDSDKPTRPFRAAVMGLVDARGQVHTVGRVGTGFTQEQMTWITNQVRAGERLVLEIEYLSMGAGGQLREPVFKAVRSDIAPDECTLSQLA